MKGIQRIQLGARLMLGFMLGAMPLAHAQVAIQPVQGCAIPKLDGEKVPFPLKTANTKFELAENETYLLNGYVVQKEGTPYFKLDFVSQPWLATYNRTQFPYVPVTTDDPKTLLMSETELVQMAVVVRRESTPSDGRELKDGFRFDLIVPPVKVLALQPASPSK